MVLKAWLLSLKVVGIFSYHKLGECWQLKVYLSHTTLWNTSKVEGFPLIHCSIDMLEVKGFMSTTNFHSNWQVKRTSYQMLGSGHANNWGTFECSRYFVARDSQSSWCLTMTNDNKRHCICYSYTVLIWCYLYCGTYKGCFWHGD